MGQSSSKTTTPATTLSPNQHKQELTSYRLALGAGCYWGTEKYIRKDFAKKFPNAVRSCRVGFMAPTDTPAFPNPTYRQVCTGASGHIEVLFIELNEEHADAHVFAELIRFFFQFHDPTTPNRQGNDQGFQYASWIFCEDSVQADIAKQVRDDLQEALKNGKLRCYVKKEVTTKISPLKEFTPAEEEHQEYLMKHPLGYCNHRIRFKSWPKIPNRTSEKQ